MSPKKNRALEKSFKFFSLAEEVANYSADKSTKVGAVALDKRLNVLCVGYNGFPRKVKDTEDRHVRPLKYKLTSHAEENVVAQAAYCGIKLRGATLIVTALFPCTTCTRLIIQSGIKRIITCVTKIDPKWEEESIISKEMLKEAGIQVIEYNKYNQIWKII